MKRYKSVFGEEKKILKESSFKADELKALHSMGLTIISDYLNENGMTKSVDTFITSLLDTMEGYVEEFELEGDNDLEKGFEALRKHIIKKLTSY